MQRRALHADKGGGARDVAAEPRDLRQEVFALEHLAGVAQRQGHDLAALVPFDDGGCDRGDLVRQHVGVYRLSGIARRHDQQPIDDVAQLADIAGPGVGLQRRQCVLAKLARLDARRRGAPRHEMAGQERDVFAPLAQGRHPDRHDVEAVEQIFAEAAAGDFGAQIAVRGGDDADVDLDPARSAHPLEGLLLKGTDDLALRFQRHVGDLVEKQRAAMRPLERADLSRLAIVAGLAAEQLDLEPVRPHRRAIYRDERSLRAPRTRVEQASDDFLAGARRAADQNAAAGRRDALDLLAQLIDRRRGTDQVELAAGAQPQLGILPAQLRGLDRASDEEQEPVGLERLLDKVVGADLDRLDRGFDRAVPADHDDRDGRHLGAQLAQDRDAVELAALQPYVEDHERWLPAMDRG